MPRRILLGALGVMLIAGLGLLSRQLLSARVAPSAAPTPAVVQAPAPPATAEAPAAEPPAPELEARVNQVKGNAEVFLPGEGRWRPVTLGQMLGPDAVLLGRTGGGALWMAALLAALLPVDRLVAPDRDAGVLDQLAIRGISEEAIAAAKLFAHWLSFGPPLMIAALPGAALMALPEEVLWRLEIGLAVHHRIDVAHRLDARLDGGLEVVVGDGLLAALIDHLVDHFAHDGLAELLLEIGDGRLARAEALQVHLALHFLQALGDAAVELGGRHRDGELAAEILGNGLGDLHIKSPILVPAGETGAGRGT